MTLDNILLVESFFHPGSRERLERLCMCITSKKKSRAEKTKEQEEIFIEQFTYLQGLVQRDIQIDVETLSDWIMIHVSNLRNRVRVMRLRAGEIGSGSPIPKLSMETRE